MYLKSFILKYWAEVDLLIKVTQYHEFLLSRPALTGLHHKFLLCSTNLGAPQNFLLRIPSKAGSITVLCDFGDEMEGAEGAGEGRETNKPCLS